MFIIETPTHLLGQTPTQRFLPVPYWWLGQQRIKQQDKYKIRKKNAIFEKKFILEDFEKVL